MLSHVLVVGILSSVLFRKTMAHLVKLLSLLPFWSKPQSITVDHLARTTMKSTANRDIPVWNAQNDYWVLERNCQPTFFGLWLCLIQSHFANTVFYKIPDLTIRVRLSYWLLLELVDSWLYAYFVIYNYGIVIILRILAHEKCHVLMSWIKHDYPLNLSISLRGGK